MNRTVLRLTVAAALVFTAYCLTTSEYEATSQWSADFGERSTETKVFIHGVANGLTGTVLVILPVGLLLAWAIGNRQPAKKPTT